MSREGEKRRIGAGFQGLWVWQKAHHLMIEVHTISNQLPSVERFRLCDQIERSSSSVADNIAEGYTSYYYKDKIKGFYTARKEAGETQNHLLSLQAKHYLAREKADKLINQYEEVIRGINGYVKWVRSKINVRR